MKLPCGRHEPLLRSEGVAGSSRAAAGRPAARRTLRGAAAALLALAAFSGALLQASAALAQERVPSDWELKPTAIDAGEQFRLLFVTRNPPGTSGSDIAAYDRVVQNRARGPGHMAIQGYADDFKVLGCTATVNARRHTETRATDTGVPIYWIDGGKLADDYNDLYDGSWDSNVARTEAGARFPTGGNDINVRTGCSDDGTAEPGESLGLADATDVAVTNARQVISFGLYKTGFRVEAPTHLFGLSPVFQVNTAPASSDSKVTATEDTSYTFTAADFVFSDDDQGDMLASVTVVMLPVAGTGLLTLSGAAVSEDDVVTAAEIVAGNLKFIPAAHANGAGHASFTFKVSDSTEDSTSSYTMTIDVTAVNDVATGIPTITGSPVVGRTLTASTAGIDDADGLPSSGLTRQWIRVAADATETNIGTDSASYTLVAADEGATIVVEVSFTDQGSTPEGPLRSAATTAVRGATANAAPTGADKTVNTPEDTAYTFLTSDFVFSDSDTGDALASVKVLTLPAAGSLTLSNAAVSVDDVVNAADIMAGNLEFTPAANANGAGHASFTFKVSDGLAESASSYTMTIDVTAVNDAPTGADKTVSTPEDTAYTFLTGDFVFSDSDTGDALASVTVVTVPDAASGSLTLSTVAVSANDVVTAADIVAGNLEFTPAANANGAGHASFTFKVSDGLAESASSYTMTIDVTAVNDAATGMPTIAGTPVVGRTLTASTVGIVDADGLPSSGFTWQWIRVATDASETNIGTDRESYTLVAADEGATIVVEVSFTDQGSTPEGPLRSAATAAVNAMATGMPMIPGTPIPQESVPSDWDLKPEAIDAGGQFRLVFVTSNQPPTSSSDIAAYDRVVQNRVRGFGHMAIQEYANGFRVLGCTSTVDARTHTGTTGTGVPIYWVGHSKVADDYSDLYDGSWDSNGARNEAGGRYRVNNVQVRTGCSDDGTAEPGASLGLAGATVVATTDAREVRTHGLHETDSNIGTGLRLFGLSPVFQVNNLPTASPSEVEATEGTDYIFAASDFVFSDDDSDALASVILTSLPATGKGELKFDGSVLTSADLDKTVTVADLGNGLLVYDPPATGTGSGFASFDFKVNDGTEESAAATMTIDVVAAVAVTSIARHDPSSSPTHEDSLTWQVTFSEAVTGVDAADFEVTGTTATLAVTGSGTTYDITASGGNLAALNGTVTLAFASGQNIEDAAANALTATTPTGTNENDYVVDNTAPTVEITGVPLTSSAAFTATFTFSEAVTGFVLSDIALVNATASNFVSANAPVYTALITPATDGTVTVNVAAAAAEDLAGNDNTAATQVSSTYDTTDTTAPGVTSIVRQNPESSPTHEDSLTWQVTFSEAVTGVDAADFTVTGTTATVTVTGSGTTYDVTASGGNLAALNGTVTLAFASGQNIEDAAGNMLSATTPTGTNNNDYVVDNTAPTVEITDVPLTSSAAFTATFTFSEAVTGFVLSDIALVNATASNFVSANAPIYTALITPATDGTVTVNVAASVAEDLAGNDNTAADQASSTYTADTTAPTVTSIVRQDPSSTPTNKDSLTWRVTFDEAVSNVDAADFSMTGTTATVTVTGSGTTYDVTASGGDLAGLDGKVVTLSFASGQDIEDAAGNALANTAPTGTNENGYVLDNTAPTVRIRGVPTTSSAPFTATFIFSEDVAGFARSDIALVNATASNFTPISSARYTALITPATDGAVTVTVAAAVAQDIAGNGNTAATPASSTYTADTTAPRVASIVRQNPESSPTHADSLTWRVTFDEAVTGVDAADFTVTGTTATPAVSAVSGMPLAYDVTASGGDLAGLNATVTLSFASGQDIEDAAANDLTNTAPTGTDEDSYVVDNTAPTVEIGGVPTTSRAAFTATFTFSEAVTGFVLSDIALVNATASNFVSANAPVYAALITPTEEGTVTVNVTASAAEDAASNGNTAAIQASSTYDTTAPTVTSIVRQDPSSTPTNKDSLTWRVTFDEAVSNVDAADFSMTGTTATVTVTGSGTTYDVTASGGDLAGLDGKVVTLSFASGQDIEDAAGNALANTAPTGTNENGYVLDNTAPTVRIRGVPTTSSAPFTATFIFSEDVAGFARSDIALVNATASNFTPISSARYTALITPATDGAVTVTVAAAVAQDIAGNGNTAATPASSTYTADTTAPRVASIVRQNPESSPTHADSLTWRVTFDEAVTGVDAADFTVTGTTATPAVSAVSGMPLAYDVTASGGDLAGLNATVTLSFASGQDIEDAAANDLTNTVPAGTNEDDYVVDNTAPRVASIVRDDPSSSPTNEDSLTWQVTFSEAVSNVTASDFEVTGTTATLAVTGSGTTYDVTASGGDLAGLTATVTLTFASGQDIEDAAANDLTNTVPAGTNEDDYVVDNTAPRVASIVRDDPSSSPTNEDSLTWQVTFSEAVSNVTASDFEVTGTTATLAVTGSGTTYEVTASGGNLAALDGTVTLAFASGQNIEDAAGNALTATTPAGTNENDYVVDNTAPRVDSIERLQSSPTHEDRLTWRVTFSEAVSNVGTADFSLSGTTAGRSIIAFSRSVYSVTASGGNLADLDATVTLSFASGQDIEDAAGNALTATTPTGTNENDYVLDNTAPTVEITGVPLTSSAAFTATFTFSEAVLLFLVDDIALGNATASNFMPTTALVATTSYTAAAYTALITPATDGAVTVDVAAGVAEDLAGNDNTAAIQASSTYTAPIVDTTAPTVASIVRDDPSSSPTHEDSLTWQVTFSEAVSNVTASDFEVTGTTATLAVTGSGTTYEVTASGGNLAALDGTVTLAFASGQDIEDAAGNALTATTPAGTNENDYVVDNTAPTVTSIVRDDPSSSPTNEDSLTWQVTFSEAVTGVDAADFEVTGTTATLAVTGTGRRTTSPRAGATWPPSTARSRSPSPPARTSRTRRATR